MRKITFLSAALLLGVVSIVHSEDNLLPAPKAETPMDTKGPALDIETPVNKPENLITPIKPLESPAPKDLVKPIVPLNPIPEDLVTPTVPLENPTPENLKAPVKHREENAGATHQNSSNDCCAVFDSLTREMKEVCLHGSKIIDTGDKKVLEVLEDLERACKRLERL